MNSVENNTFTSQEDIFRSNRRILCEHYDIGQLVHQERIYRGYINKSYKIEMLRDGKKSRYLMRRYRKGTSEEKVSFEHSLLHELQLRRFKFSPRSISTKDGNTYVRISRQLNNETRDKHIAVFSFLPGEDKYSWDTPLCSDEELRHSAKILNLYHNTIFGWQGIESWREQSTIDGVGLMAAKWKSYAQNTEKFPFDEYFLEQLNDLLKMLSRRIPPLKKYHAMPRLAIHGDYHPGNLKFSGGEVTGVFDFGWSKIDVRCFDVGLAIMYFCTTWENNNGILQLDRVESFLEAYQEITNKTKTIGSLNKLELEYLPHMIHIGNLIVVDWILYEFYRTGLTPEQYLKYLQHSMSLNRWLEGNWEELTYCIQRH